MRGWSRKSGTREIWPCREGRGSPGTSASLIAVLHGRLTPWRIGFSEIEWEGVRATFHAELVDIERKSAGAHKPVTYYDGHSNKVQIDGGIPGAGIFYIDAARFRIPPGFHMVWRTLAGSGRIEE